MDPYVVVNIEGNKQKTKTHNSGGKNPRWEETLRFKITKEQEMKIAVYDEDMTSDDLVGETTMFLDDIKKKGHHQEWVKIQYKGKEAGLVK